MNHDHELFGSDFDPAFQSNGQLDAPAGTAPGRPVPGEGARRAGGRRGVKRTDHRARTIVAVAGAVALVTAGTAYGMLRASDTGATPALIAVAPPTEAPSAPADPSASLAASPTLRSPGAEESSSPSASPAASAGASAGASPSASAARAATPAASEARASGGPLAAPRTAGSAAAAKPGGAQTPPAKSAPSEGGGNGQGGAGASGQGGRLPDGAPVNAPTVSGSWPASQSVADADAISLQLINKERALAGVPALLPKEDLAVSAAQWAQHMRETGFAHSANASGAGPNLTSERTLTGECIVMYSDASMTAEQAAVKFQDMWRNHGPHYLAQINPKYKEIGVGMYHDASGWWGVHEFGG